jgi:hypothetical protein
VKIVKNKKNSNINNQKKKVISFDKIDGNNTCEDSFLDCSSELVEEEYV